MKTNVCCFLVRDFVLNNTQVEQNVLIGTKVLKCLYGSGCRCWFWVQLGGRNDYVAVVAFANIFVKNSDFEQKCFPTPIALIT